MDRFDDKAREILDEIKDDGMPRLSPLFERLTAAILRAAAELAPKGAGERGKEKPVAGEWERSGGLGHERSVGRWSAARAFHDGCWAVFRLDHAIAVRPGSGEKAADLASAMLAADAWVRAHANDLDWRLPEPVEQPAPLSPDLMARMAEALRPIAEMAVGRESWQDDSFGTGESVPLYLARHARALLAEYDDATKEPTP